MKKVLATIFAMVLMCSATMAYAGNVSADQARSAAANYMSQMLDRGTIQASELTLAYQIDNEQLDVASIYFFNLPKEGWVAITGTTLIDPIVAYSEKGTFNVETAPANMMFLINSQARYIAALQNEYADYTGNESFGEWEDLLNGKYVATKANNKLMSEEWDQGDIYSPTYNIYCPQTGGKYCYVGCVATAMSQIMHYWRYPEQPTGRVRTWFSPAARQLALYLDTVQFDFSLMPDRLKSNSTQAQIEATALLCYAAGLSVEMDYGTDGSGTQSYKVPSALNTNFGYKLGDFVSRDYSIDDTSFIGRLRRDLQSGRPVYMSGSSTSGSGADAAGHAWVCCGYQDANENMYYMNWGWGHLQDYYHGGYCNTWFNLRTNSMAVSEYNFTESQDCIYGVYPDTAEDVSVEMIDETSVLPAYPNPATMSVTLPYSLTSAADLQVYGIDGKLVYTTRLQAGNGDAVVNVSEMPAGVYLYRLNGASGKFIVR